MFLQLVGRVSIVAFYVVAVVLIAIVPIKMGRDANKNIPIIAELEQMGQEYCEVTLKRATAAYIISKTIDKVVSTIQRTELTFAPFGIGLTVATGEMFSAVNDAISRFCAAFFWVIGITLLGQLAAGMLTFVCIKVLLPTSLICIALYSVFPRHFQWAKNIAYFAYKNRTCCIFIFPNSGTCHFVYQ